jgi:hypothetical protein
MLADIDAANVVATFAVRLGAKLPRKGKMFTATLSHRKVLRQTAQYLAMDVY